MLQWAKIQNFLDLNAPSLDPRLWVVALEKRTDALGALTKQSLAILQVRSTTHQIQDTERADYLVWDGNGVHLNQGRIVELSSMPLAVTLAASRSTTIITYISSKLAILKLRLYVSRTRRQVQGQPLL